MELVSDLKEITKPFENAVVTIGNFDGVHIGHRALFRQVIEKVPSAELKPDQKDQDTLPPYDILDQFV